MRKILLTLLTTLLCSVTAWADVTLFSCRFDTLSEGSITGGSTTFTAGGKTLQATAKSKKTISWGGDNYLNFNNQNDASGYTHSVRIPITGVNSQTITITITHEYSSAKASYKYGVTKTDGTNVISQTGQAAASNGANVVITITTLTSGVSDFYVYIGQNSSSYIRLQSITITTPSPSCAATIPGNISKGSACAGADLTLTSAGSPETGDTWYWQASSSGTATTNSGTTYDVSSAGTYYVRSYNTSGTCWSDAKSVTVAAGDWTSPSISGASSVTVGNTITLTGSPSGGSWESSDETKATVNSSGVVSGVAIGNTNITYSKDGCTSTDHAVTVSAACTDPDLNITLK